MQSSRKNAGCRFPRMVCVLIAAAVCIVAVSAARAQPLPTLTAVDPPVVQRGIATTVLLRGERLDEVQSLAPADMQGVAVELLQFVKRFGQDSAPNIELRVTVPAEAALGDRELRVVTPHGVSNAIKLHVSAYRPVMKDQPGDDLSYAQEVELPAVLVGAMDQPGDIDLYRFTAKAGEQLVFHVHAERLGSALDSVIAIYNEQGREVAWNNDQHGRDSLARFEVESDGKYTLEIRDLKYRGGEGYHYRVEAGAIPYVESVFPLGARRGRIVELQPVGFNLPPAKSIEVDLCDADFGATVMPAPVRGGPTWWVKFDVGSLRDMIERESNDTQETAERVDIPVAINGRIDRPRDVDHFRFVVKEKSAYRIEAAARRLGSPMDPLLELYAADGALVERNDDTMGADARIIRELEAGEYVVAISDLVHAGGERYAYRLEIEPYAGERHDFAVRFLPDAPRVHRGGHVKMWCEIARAGGYPGEVTLELIGLPEGVRCEPVTLGPDTSGVFTIAASADAALGTSSFRVRARGMVRGEMVERIAQAEFAGRPVHDAYLTVLDALPFEVAPLDAADPAILDRYGREMRALRQTLATHTDELAESQRAWEASLSGNPPWVVAEPLAFSAMSEATLTGLADGSILASGPTPNKDEYRLVARSPLTGITAIKVELIADESLPGGGPGRARTGNFVLSHIAVREGGATRQLQSVELLNPTASFEQDGYPVVNALDQRPMQGWAINPRTGSDQHAIFRTGRALGDSADGMTILDTTITQEYGDNHVIGRLRLAVTTAKDPQPGMTLPVDIAEILAKSPRERGEAEADRLAGFYRSIAPSLEPARQRLAMLEKVIGPALELRELEAKLAAQTPELDGELTAWADKLAEATARGGAELDMSPWHVVGPFKEANADLAYVNPFPPEAGVDLSASYAEGRLKWTSRHDWIDGEVHNVFVEPNAAHYLYRTIDTTFERPVTLSFGSDDAIKVWVNGDLVVDKNSRRAAAPDQERATVTLRAGRNTILMKIINEGDRSGFYFKALDTLPPPEVLAIVALSADQRTGEQRAALEGYYRDIAPSLEPVREALRELRVRSAVFPPRTARGRTALVPLRIARQDGWNGELRVSLEGYTAGRAGDQPSPFGASHESSPVAVGPGEEIAMLQFRPRDTAAQATRLVVLRVDANVGGYDVTTYSPAFPLQVE